jgi:two-component system, chemotaxis family, sensor kinase CheA
MDGLTSSLIEIALTAGRALALQLNERLAIRVVHNAPLLLEWRGKEDALPAALRQLLEELLPLARATQVLQQVQAAAADADEAGIALGTVVLRVLHGGGPDRSAALSLHRGAATDAPQPLVLVMRDVTPLAGTQQSLASTRESLDAALVAVRAPPQALRLFLTAAMASVNALRATMKLPARTQEAVQAKLARLKEAADQIGNEARTIGLASVDQACSEFTQQVVGLREKSQVTGDDMLPLAPLLDAIASGVGNCARIEEQRYIAPAKAPAAAPRSARSQAEPRKDADEWAHAAERRWNNFLRQRGEELGTLVKLSVQDAQLVPANLRRDVDDMLQHLLRNAVEHGIETPEQRLAADKPAAGLISVRFEDRGARGLHLTFRDDGRGFDVVRIGRAAVLSGIVSEESLLEYDPGEVVGLIFKPNFSTENLEGEAGRGRGMNFLRRTVTRLFGQVSVATKPGRYTRFEIHLPTPG